MKSKKKNKEPTNPNEIVKTNERDHVNVII